MTNKLLKMNIKGYYYIWCINNYFEVVIDQWNVLVSSGLFVASKTININTL